MDLMEEGCGLTARWVEFCTLQTSLPTLLVLIYLQNTTSPWPKWAEILLKTRIAETGLLKYQLASEQYALMLHGIGKEFLHCVDYSGWEGKHGMLLWQKLRRKAEHIYHENQRRQAPRDLTLENIIEYQPSIQNISYKAPRGSPWGTSSNIGQVARI